MIKGIKSNTNIGSKSRKFDNIDSISEKTDESTS